MKLNTLVALTISSLFAVSIANAAPATTTPDESGQNPAMQQDVNNPDQAAPNGSDQTMTPGGDASQNPDQPADSNADANSTGDDMSDD